MWECAFRSWRVCSRIPFFFLFCVKICGVIDPGLYLCSELLIVSSNILNLYEKARRVVYHFGPLSGRFKQLPEGFHGRVMYAHMHVV